MITIFLQGLFVLRGLPFMKTTTHFTNCMVLKIKFAFSLLCCLMAISVLSFSLLSTNFSISTYIGAFIMFLILKAVLHFLIYKTTKYKDDGRDLVSGVDFVSIHCTFPAMNAWVTYQTLYVFLMTLSAVCPEKAQSWQKNLSYDWCNKWQGLDENLYYYAMLVIPSKVCFILIFVEMAIFITYYKDVVFAFITFTNFCGMYYNSYKKLDDADKHWIWSTRDDPAQSAEIKSLDHPLLKASEDHTDFNSPQIIHNWLIGLVFFNLLWIAVTLVADWRTCFYRKAAQYKRRVETAIEQRKQQMLKTQEKMQIESSTATFIDSTHYDEGQFDKSMRVDKEMEKVREDLLDGEQSYERSESFKRFVQYEQLQENIEISDHNKNLDDQYAMSADATPSLFRRDSKPNARISLMKAVSYDFNREFNTQTTSNPRKISIGVNNLNGLSQTVDTPQDQLNMLLQKRNKDARKSTQAIIPSRTGFGSTKISNVEPNNYRTSSDRNGQNLSGVILHEESSRTSSGVSK